VAEESTPRKRKRRDGEDGKPATPRERMARGYARAEERNQAARDALQPLDEGDRPLVVTVGAVLSALIAASIVIGYLAGGKVNGEAPRLPQVIAPALLMGMMAFGMWRARYWAVLGFQIVLVFLIFAAFSGIAIQASSAAEFAYYLVLLAISGTLFFFMVKAMARIQMPKR
jgi:peptidoglycan/LPS O-acetylase OafA/YrhL